MVLFGRGGRNRTLLWSFGDSHSTDELHPYISLLIYNTPIFVVSQMFFITKK